MIACSGKFFSTSILISEEKTIYSVYEFFNNDQLLYCKRKKYLLKFLLAHNIHFSITTYYVIF